MENDLFVQTDLFYFIFTSQESMLSDYMYSVILIVSSVAVCAY